MAITSSLEGGSAMNDMLGTGHIVSGTITAGAGTDAVLTCNDRSAVLTRAAAGNYTVTFGDPFIGTPAAYLTPMRATFATTAGLTCEIVSLSTTALNLSLIKNTLATATTALGSVVLSDGASGDGVHFVVVGKRYN